MVVEIALNIENILFEQDQNAEDENRLHTGISVILTQRKTIQFNLDTHDKRLL